MTNQNLILAAVFIPLVLAFALPVIGKFSRNVRNVFALLLALVAVVSSSMLLPVVAKGNIVNIFKPLQLGFNFSFSADPLAVFMAIVSSFISAVIILYSFGYISHYENQNEYYLMVVLFLGGMMGLVFSANLIFLYIFWEITAVTSWRLIGFFREKQHVLRADKAFMVTVFGALLMLIGFIRLGQEMGSFDLFVIKDVIKIHPVSNVTIALILAGIFSKSATLPFQTWLPDAGVAPSPVTALLHAAVLVKIGVYVFARIFVATIPLAQFWHTAVPVIAGLSALIAAGAALVETDLKRLIAYSTISQIGFIFLGLAIGSDLGFNGGLLYILMHGLAKGGLFLCAGIIEQNTKTKDITKLGGLIHTMPITAISFLFCSFSIMGIPPFGGFFAKYMVIASSLGLRHFVIAAIFLLGAFLTIIYLFRAFNLVFLGETKIAAKEKEPVMVFSVALLSLLSLAGGILIRYPYEIAQLAAVQMPALIK